MPKKKLAKGGVRISPLDGASQFQEAVEVSTNRQQEAEKECKIHYRALISQCTNLPDEDQKRCVQEATEAYRDMLAACRLRFEAELRAARVLLDVNLGEANGKLRK